MRLEEDAQGSGFKSAAAAIAPVNVVCGGGGGGGGGAGGAGVAVAVGGGGGGGDDLRAADRLGSNLGSKRGSYLPILGGIHTAQFPLYSTYYIHIPFDTSQGPSTNDVPT